MTTWLFPDPPETNVLTLRSILKGGPVLFVDHDAIGGWHFLDDRSIFTRAELILAPLSRILELDPSLPGLADLPVGWRALRWNKDDPWQRESSLTLEVTRARSREALAAAQRAMIVLPPGSPTTLEMLHEGRK